MTMRVINNGLKAVQVGRGQRIEPGHTFDCDQALGEQLLIACPFVSQLEEGKSKDETVTSDDEKQPAVKADTDTTGPKSEDAPKKTAGKKKEKPARTEEVQKDLL